MSGSELVSDILHGNFSNAYARLADWYNGWPVWLKVFASKLATQEGSILKSLVEIAAADIMSGGLSTASFVNAGKDVFAKLTEQNISIFTIQDVMTALNGAVAAQTPVAGS